MYTNHQQMLRAVCCWGKDMNHSLLSLICTDLQDVISVSSAHAHLTCFQPQPIMVRKVRMMLITKGGEVFSLPSRHFLTHAIIHYVMGTLVWVKYWAEPTLSFDLAGGPYELWLRKCFLLECVYVCVWDKVYETESVCVFQFLKKKEKTSSRQSYPKSIRHDRPINEHHM